MYAFTVEPFNKEIKTMDDYGMAKKNAPNYRAYFEINILIKSLICRKKSLTLLIKTFWTAVINTQSNETKKNVL